MTALRRIRMRLPSGRGYAPELRALPHPAGQGYLELEDKHGRHVMVVRSACVKPMMIQFSLDRGRTWWGSVLFRGGPMGLPEFERVTGIRLGLAKELLC